MFLEIMLGAFVLGKEYIKEKNTPVIPAGYWNNKELIYKDRVERHISTEEFMRNLHNGKYYLPEPQKERTMRDVIEESLQRDREERERRASVYSVWYNSYPVDRTKGGKKREYKEIFPYEKNPKYFKVYDEEWGIWVVVEKYPKVNCDYVALYDKETMDGMIERHPFIFK